MRDHVGGSYERGSTRGRYIENRKWKKNTFSISQCYGKNKQENLNIQFYAKNNCNITLWVLF